MGRAMRMAVTFLLASAGVEANQCSSGGECPSDDEPQSVVSLHQTNLGMNVLEDVPSMMKNPSAMLTELEGMVGSGETPAFDLITTIKSLIQDDVMQCLQTTRDAAAQATTDALAAVQLCNTASKTEEGRIEKIRQESVNNARSLHSACREAEKTLYDHNLTNADSYCVKLGKFLHGATSLEIPDSSTRDHSVDYVKDASLKNMCSCTKATEWDNFCTASEAELADKKVECSANQRSYESEFCAWKTELESNCKTLDTCHSAAVTAYHNHVRKTHPLVEKWNVETAALLKILCYCNVWLSEKDDGDDRSKHNATQFDVCKDRTHTPVPVNYGTPAEKIACLLTPVANHPGTSGFITQEYGSFADFCEPVASCNQAAPSPPTPPPALSCSSVTCGAAYNIGSNLTCPGGNTTYCKEICCDDKAMPAAREGDCTEVSINGQNSTQCTGFSCPAADKCRDGTLNCEEYSDPYPLDCPCDKASCAKVWACIHGHLEKASAITVEACNRVDSRQKGLTVPGNFSRKADEVCCQSLFEDCKAFQPTCTDAIGKAFDFWPLTRTCQSGDEGPDCFPQGPIFTFGEEGMVDGCPPGYSAIFLKGTCEQGASYLGLSARGIRGDDNHEAAYPGCYFFKDGSEMAYFNTHPNPQGTWHPEHAGQICKADGRDISFSQRGDEEASRLTTASLVQRQDSVASEAAGNALDETIRDKCRV